MFKPNPLASAKIQKCQIIPLSDYRTGFALQDVSTASNYLHNLKHQSPPGLKWRQLFEVWLPFTAKLSVTFGNGQLHILNAACPVWARKTHLGSACREATILTKMHRGKTRWTLTTKCLAKIRTLLKNSIPKIYLALQDEVHIAGDKSSIAYRKRLAALGLGRSFTA